MAARKEAPKTNFFTKRNLTAMQIMYFTRKNQKTIIHLINGNEIETYLPLKTLLANIDSEAFIVINKGIALAKSHIVKVESGVYTVTDGTQYKGRIRTPGAHMRNSIAFTRATDGNRLYQAKTWQEYAVLENMSLPFSIIELVFDNEGHGMDLIVRYCNKAVEEFEGMPISSLLNRSFFEVFKYADKKLLITYADVALNGTNKVIEVDDPRHKFKMYCYQPKANMCACVCVCNE